MARIKEGHGAFALVEVDLEGGGRIVASAARLAVADLAAQGRRSYLRAHQGGVTR